jgi:hypothetical protein
MTETKDAFDQFWEWANKPEGSDLSIPWDLHGAVRELSPDDQMNRERVNQAVREARDPNIKHRWVYESGNHLEVFGTFEEGNAWLEENDPEGVLWRERVIEHYDPDPPSLEDTCGVDVTGIQRATGKHKP